jgi:hypothetical protein
MVLVGESVYDLPYDHIAIDQLTCACSATEKLS